MSSLAFGKKGNECTIAWPSCKDEKICNTKNGIGRGGELSDWMTSLLGCCRLYGMPTRTLPKSVKHRVLNATDSALMMRPRALSSCGLPDGCGPGP